MIKLTTLAEKQAYFELVKLASFHESSRLQGIILPTKLTSLPKNDKEFQQAKKAIIDCYK